MLGGLAVVFEEDAVKVCHILVADHVRNIIDSFVSVEEEPCGLGESLIPQELGEVPACLLGDET